MTIDPAGSFGLTQMAGSSALSPVVSTGAVSASALTFTTPDGTLARAACNGPVSNTPQRRPAAIFHFSLRLGMGRKTLFGTLQRSRPGRNCPDRTYFHTPA
jgi:hypothetical protein